MSNTLTLILNRLTGRNYSHVDIDDLSYLYQKGAIAFLRGGLWSAIRFRRHNRLMLGGGTKFISSRNLSLGRGVFIGGNSYLDFSASQPVSIGRGSTLREFAWIQCRSGLNGKGEGLIIEDNVYIGPFSVIGVGAKVIIGRGCQIGARLTISAESHEPREGSYVTGGIRRKGVKIGSNVWIGNNVTVLDGVEIGNNAVIGAGALVSQDIPPGSIAYGVPARPIRNV